MLNKLLIFRNYFSKIHPLLRHAYLIGFYKQANLPPTQASHTSDQTVTPPFGELQSMQPGKLVIRPVYPSQHSYLILRHVEQDEKDNEVQRKPSEAVN
jgi:hypothetical protein